MKQLLITICLPLRILNFGADPSRGGEQDMG